MFWILLLIGIVLIPSFAAAFFSLVFKLVCLLFKLAFTFWQITIFVIIVMFLCSLGGSL